MQGEMVLPFTNLLAQNITISGGKGTNLAKLSQIFPVPPGLVVTSYSYTAWIEPLKSSVLRILKSGISIEKQSRQIQQMFLNSTLPQQLINDLRQQLNALHANDWVVAVRSSATLEDLPGAAFAGQHDTFLNCFGLDEILNAIRKCYASLWNEHAMHYRNRLRLQHLDAAMAVVIQKMVQVTEKEAAGVAFSVDPVKGNLSHVLINSAFGLGESVVSGEYPVDEFRMDAVSQCVVESNIASKSIALVGAQKAGEHISGTREIVLDAEQGEMPSLTQEQCLQIAALAKQAESFFVFPQDIEWAYSVGELYLLQSRPVTSVPERWTRDESAERFPNVVTPLTWDLVEEGFHTSLNYSFQLMGLPHFGGKWFGMKDFYIYGNQNAVELYSNRIPFRIESLEDVRKAIPMLVEKFTWVQDLPALWMRDLDTYLLAVGSFMQEPVEQYSTEKQWDYIKRIRDVGTQYFLPNIAISLTQRILYTALYKLVSFAVEPAQVQPLYDQLLGACQTKTVEVNKELWNLSREIRHTPELMHLFERFSVNEVLEKMQLFPAFGQKFHLFLQRHGHRELDFDAYYPTWLEAPHTVLDQLKGLSELEDKSRPENELQAIVAATSARQQLVAHVPEDLRYLVEEVIRLARVYTQLDDLEHYQTTRLTLPFRKGLKAMGSRLVEQGILKQHSDIYFVPFAELDKAISENDFSHLAAICEINKAAWEKAKENAPAWVYGENDDVPEVGDTNALKGLSGSPGQVEGEVFLVHSPEEFSQFPQNAILVARTTNPAWTTLFYRAKGVITESGGPLSHGAVTARELGIPAVMSVRNVMSQLQNGMRVSLDGEKGVVSIVKSA